MSRGQTPGELELTVMLALASGDRPLSSREVYEAIVSLTGRELAVASVHVTLDRLEDKGLVDRSMAPGPEGLGRDVKHFALTDRGVEILKESRTYWNRLWTAALQELGER